MVIGSIALPGAVLMVNNDLSDSIQNRLVIQLHIDEVITGEQFDVRLAGDPDYVRNNRILRRRVMVVRNHQDTNNRLENDIVLFIKEGMASVTKSCFGPPGQTYLVKNLYWGALCIYNTDIDRTCKTACAGGGCGCPCHYSAAPDGYATNCNTPYYPATYDPNFPEENHSYNNTRGGCSGCGANCGQSPDKVLCGQYRCDANGCIQDLDCRLVKS